MLKKVNNTIINKKSKNIFLKYNFYQSIFKKGKKYYFLLDFFKGLKGYFLFKNVKKIKRKSFLYKSFDNFKNLNNLNSYDYLYNNLNIKFFNYLKKTKKLKNIWFITLIEDKNFYSLNLKNI
jgi:hypothetical protein